MGRVDEAMRRARGEGSTPVSPAGTDGVESVSSVEPGSELLDEFEAPDAESAAPAAPEESSSSVAVEPPASMFRGLDAELEGKVVIDREIVAESREQYRRLAATLLHGQSNSGLKVIMVTSAAVAEGKTLTAVNLALTFSESYRRRVLLIDGD